MFDPISYVGFHTDLSLLALVVGIILTAALFRSRVPSALTALYLATAVLTDITGFGFPFTGFLPSHGVGLLSLLILALATAALYAFALRGPWRWIYAASLTASVFLLAFVAVAQSFLKVPALHALAPTGSEPPFGAAEGVLLLLFAVAGFLATRRFRPTLRTTAITT
ncbi:hypothetical protein [Nitrospirillum iridis]|uniref:Phosphoglycerol transferase MdoB-like AlkP superfamily enzyme n=1 Tax=Nitrospirillum iridis TaxID=765888 RepID=A0A7X0B0L4_9PROT|nr:hypothetical protein [Nitrospirillum iridis]MBB6252776.1 phosphoglycerol transferase MdoB-like AlkP superfamily enzyme [Nitrospirillum iridis]